MTPADRKALRQANNRVEYAEALWRLWEKFRAVVRCECGYTPEVLRNMTWREMREAYKDCIVYQNIIRR